MFEFSNLMLFIGAAVALNLTPGPDMLYCATRAVGQGRAAGIISGLAIGTGGLLHTVFAAMGLSALLMFSATAFTIVKYAGAAYLVYLGVRTVMSRGGASSPKRLAHASLSRIFFQGVVTSILNPKVALFFLSFLPQFVDPSRGSVALQVLILGVIITCTGTTVNVSVGLLFGQIGGWLDRRPTFWKFQRWVTGSVFVALGASLALPDRN